MPISCENSKEVVNLNIIKNEIIMKNKTNDFSNWLEDMTFGFDNDFLNVDKSKINNLLLNSEIKEID